jgi:RNA polymerase sigma-70 factor (ECF subfamily)
MQARQGQVGAFIQLIRRYQGYVQGLAMERLGDRAAAEAVSREVFVRAWQSCRQWADPPHFAAELRELTETVAGERQETRCTAPPPPSAFHPPSPAREALVRAALRRLDETERLPLLLYSLGGHSAEGVANFLDWPVETVRARVRQAQQRLREELNRLVEEAFPLQRKRGGEGLKVPRYQAGRETGSNRLAGAASPLGVDFSPAGVDRDLQSRIARSRELPI